MKTKDKKLRNMSLEEVQIKLDLVKDTIDTIVSYSVPNLDVGLWTEHLITHTLGRLKPIPLKTVLKWIDRDAYPYSHYKSTAIRRIALANGYREGVGKRIQSTTADFPFTPTATFDDEQIKWADLHLYKIQ